MGMDVYGLGNKEAYFRANIWSWHPMWDYITAECHDILTPGEVDRGHYNGALTVLAPKARAMHARLTEAIKTGRAAAYLAAAGETPKKDLSTIPGGGDLMEALRNLTKAMDPDTRRTSGFYSFTLPHFQEFVDFLAVCEGFEVQ